MFVHGALAALHALGVVYHLRHRTHLDAALHAGAAIYDLAAVVRHRRRLLDE